MNNYRIAKSISLLVSVSFFLMVYCMKTTVAIGQNDRSQREPEMEKLREEITMNEARCQVVDTRLSALNKSIIENRNDLERIEQEHFELMKACNQRLKEIYKNGDIGFLEVILDVKNFEDFLGRISYLQKINQSDKELISSCNYKRKRMLLAKKKIEESKTEEIALRKQKTAQRQHLKTEFAREQYLLDQADVQTQKYIAQKQEAEKTRRKIARAQSVPLGVKVKNISCTVFPYLGNTYVTSERMPSDYKATGIKLSGIASWYGNEFNGKPTASGEIYNENDFTCASKTLPFGTFLCVTYGNKSVVVKVTDRGPFVEGRVLDLSKASAKALGISGIGFAEIEVLEKR